MVAEYRRKVIEIGKESLMCTLPVEWTRANRLAKGATLNVQIADDGSLRIVPLKVNQDGEGGPAAQAPTSAPTSPDSNQGGQH